MIIPSVVVIERLCDDADELDTDVLCEEVANVHDGGLAFPAEPFLGDTATDSKKFFVILHPTNYKQSKKYV